MELKPIYRRVIGLDIHQAKISACAVSEQSDGSVVVEMREFGGFKRDRRSLAQWAKSFAPEIVVMESTGIYWKSPYAALESVGIAARVVNARHVKTVPGRKTDVADAQWLAATLARAGLLRGSFIPPANIRYLRSCESSHERNNANGSLMRTRRLSPREQRGVSRLVSLRVKSGLHIRVGISFGGNPTSGDIHGCLRVLSSGAGGVASRQRSRTVRTDLRPSSGRPTLRGQHSAHVRVRRGAFRALGVRPSG
jgi:hypothetical protein